MNSWRRIYDESSAKLNGNPLISLRKRRSLEKKRETFLSHELSGNIYVICTSTSEWNCSLGTGQKSIKMLRCQSSYFQLKTGYQVFWKRFLFFRNLFQSESIENVENLPLFPHKPMLFLSTLKWNLSENSFSCVKAKTNSNFAKKPAERSNRSFSVYFMNQIFQTFVLFIMWKWNV